MAEEAARVEDPFEARVDGIQPASEKAGDAAADSKGGRGSGGGVSRAEVRLSVPIHGAPYKEVAGGPGNLPCVSKTNLMVNTLPEAMSAKDGENSTGVHRVKAASTEAMNSRFVF